MELSLRSSWDHGYHRLASPLYLDAHGVLKWLVLSLLLREQLQRNEQDMKMDVFTSQAPLGLLAVFIGFLLD